VGNIEVHSFADPNVVLLGSGAKTVSTRGLIDANEKLEASYPYVIKCHFEI
jgi:hypothetical protein